MSIEYSSVKRMLDIAVSAGALLTTAPIIAAAAAAVRLTSPGPAFYRSRRVGKDGKEFDLLKLRTMTVANNDDIQVTAGTNSRITPVGRILRKTKLDELPQFINVLTGDVSLVGPRPEAPVFVKRYPEAYERILSIRPGLTDRATIEFVGEEELLAGVEDPEKFYVEEIMPRKMACYLKYIETKSLTEDIDILFRTAVHVAGRGVQLMTGKLKS